MNKEPIGLYILRYILSFALLAFMAMLYWSSVLIEGDLKELRSDLTELKNDIFELRNETQIANKEVLEVLVDDQDRQTELFKILLTHGAPKDLTSLDIAPVRKEKKVSGLEDTSLPNMFGKDLFYEKTLPKLLGKGFRPTGVRHGFAVNKPENLHPFSGWRDVGLWQDLCIPNVGTMQFGKYETFAPGLAYRVEERKMKESDIPEFWVFLRDNVYWQPLVQSHFPEDVQLAPHFLRKHQVTAHDIKFWYDALMNPYNQEGGAVALRTYLTDIDEIEVLNDLTFVVRWKTQDVNGRKRVKYSARNWTRALQPLPRFVYQYFPDGSKIVEDDSDANTYRTNSVWAQNFAEHWAKNVIVGCGGYFFDGMTDKQIRFKRNPGHYKPLEVLVEANEYEIKESAESAWQGFKAGKIDTYLLRSDQLVELEEFLLSDAYRQQESQGLKIHRLEYLSRMYSYIGWNQERPFFASTKVRRAMTMAIDRRRIIQQNLNGLGVEITGSFFYNSPSYDKSIEPWPFDPQEAKRLLEEEGWFDSDGDGIVDKEINGQRVPFKFTLTYYVKRPQTKAICEYIATALKEIGVSCQLNGVDIADLSAAFEDRSFDAIAMGWALGAPPEDPKQLWHSSGAKEKGSSNAVGFVNEEADAIIEKLQYEYNREERIKLYHRFHRILHDEQPYTFLYDPKSVMLYRDYVQNVFIPAERQDLIPGADVATPDSSVTWLKPRA